MTKSRGHNRRSIGKNRNSRVYIGRAEDTIGGMTDTIGGAEDTMRKGTGHNGRRSRGHHSGRAITKILFSGSST